MQRLALQMEGIFFIPVVYRVSQQGMGNAGHMDPYLVGAPGLQATLDICVFPISLYDLIMGHGAFAASGMCGHPFPVCGMPPDGGVDGPSIFFDIPLDDSVVDSVDRDGYGHLCR